MKLRKQTGLKSAILAATVGLLLALTGLIRSEADSGIGVEAVPTAEAPDYEGIFTPIQTGQASERGSTGTTEAAQPRADTRTRAS